MFTGLTATSKDALLLDAGAFFKNYVIASDTYATAVSAGKLIGATAGGGSFSAVPNVRQIELDGAKSNTKGLEVIDNWVVTMTANVKEATLAAMELALGAASHATYSSDYEKVSPGSAFADADYETNITWVGKLAGSALPVIIVINNALSLNGLTMNFEDKNEAVIPITITGHYPLTDLDTPPFEIYYPLDTPVVVPSTYSHTSGDIVLKVGGGAVTAVMNGETALTATTHYTYVDPTLTLKDAYLTTLTGEVPLTIVTANGNVTFTVTT
jgi:hypothetical protein